MPRKLGQHFLKDSKAALRIAKEVYGKVLEIGGGRGALTRFLVERASNLVVVEKDRELAEYLRERFPEAEVIEGDFLSLEPFQVDVIVGNVPYYISSKILFKLYEWNFEKSILMLQKEFVEKMLAEPGTKAYGRLSINAQDCYEIKKLFCVGRKSFSPPPKVDSCVVRLSKKERKLEGLDWLIVKLFSQKNKKIKNIVPSPEHLAEKRPWQLTPEDIQEIAKMQKISSS